MLSREQLKEKYKTILENKEQFKCCVFNCEEIAISAFPVDTTESAGRHEEGYHFRCERHHGYGGLLYDLNLIEMEKEIRKAGLNEKRKKKQLYPQNSSPFKIEVVEVDK